MKTQAIFGLLALLAAPATVMAQAETLDYTASITGGSGIFASDTGTIGGTYTFNYSNAELSVGTVGSAQGWESYTSDAYVFTSTAFSTSSGNNVSYSDGAPGALSDQSVVAAILGGVSFLSYNQQQPDLLNYQMSTLAIQSTGTPWTSAGLPTLGPGDQAAGEIDVEINGALSELDYNVNSVKIAPTSAPEIGAPSAAGAMTLLLGGLAVVLRGRNSSKLG